jgi:hypothetical protein
VLTFFIFKPRQQRDIRRLQIHFEHIIEEILNKNPPFLSKVSKDFFESDMFIFGALTMHPTCCVLLYIYIWGGGHL